MNRALSLLLIPLIFSSAASAQLSQDHPELCGGTRGFGALPTGLSVGPGNGETAGETILKLTKGGAEGSIIVDVPRIGVCALPGDQLITFGESGDGNIYMERISASSLERIGFLAGRNPVVSPDAHWLVMRHFHHFALNEEEDSEVYLLYDLTKDAKANAIGVTPESGNLIGKQIYPVPHPGMAFETAAGLAPELYHRFRAQSFFWDQASQTVVFADSQEDRLAVVMISLGSGQPSTLARVVDLKDVCESTTGGEAPGLTMTGAEFGPVEGSDRMVTLHWTEADPASPYPPGSCKPHDLSVHLVDFVRPEPEVHTPVKRLPWTLNGVPLHIPDNSQ